MEFALDQLRSRLANAASRGVWIGTSSWKYTGWIGMLYEHDRYIWRGKFAESRFEKNCLSEYAATFRTVCVDAAYYTFPTEKQLRGLVAQVPGDFCFTFKVTDDITIKRFPNLARFGARAGKPNENFLNADLFARMFLVPLESIRSNVGMLIFEFSKFWPSDYASGREFVSDIDRFLGVLPQGWDYGVEMRNRNWLKPEYFECLNRHRVAHVFNSWADMPSVTEQMSMKGSFTHGEIAAARFLLKPGRTYEQAVSAFKPYDKTRDPLPEAREAGSRLIRRGVHSGTGRTFIYVNNRLEGNALNTIHAMLEQAGA